MLHHHFRKQRPFISSNDLKQHKLVSYERLCLLRIYVSLCLVSFAREIGGMGEEQFSNTRKPCLLWHRFKLLPHPHMSFIQLAAMPIAFTDMLLLLFLLLLFFIILIIITILLLIIIIIIIIVVTIIIIIIIIISFIHIFIYLCVLLEPK